MLPEIGHIALHFALVLAIAQASLPLIGAHRGDVTLIALARPTALLQCAMIGLAFAILTHAYVISDFSVLNVAQNSHTAKPMLYKISGVWGNHEGSLLLWALILALCGAAVALFGRNLPAAFRARVLAVQAVIAVGFLLFLLWTSNPFARLVPVPIEGNGLNPLLQDPGLAFHPPFLYLGYVGLSVAFSFAIAALIEGRVDAAWARWVRPWTLAAWSFLTIGITLGSWWAYYELGWGGWWFWDPVENASFMPWLAATALLHSAIVVEKRDTLKGWTILLAILAFSLSLLGTFLVRSGVLTSVHAFATDPARGVFILLFLAFVVAGSLTLYAFRVPRLAPGGLFLPISREGALLLNNLLLATATATVFVGTLYPLFLDSLTGEKISVGPPYFNATFGPLMVPVLFAMAIGPFLRWKRSDLASALQRLRIAALAAFIVAGFVFALVSDAPLLAVFGLALGAWLIVGALAELADRIKLGRAPLQESLRRLGRVPRAAFGMVLAHAGAGVILVGIVASTTWQVERLQVMQAGDTTDVGPYQFTFHGAAPVTGPNYQGQSGHFTIQSDGETIAELHPETRNYPNPPMQTTEAAIRPRFSGDLYAVLGEAVGDDGWATRLYFKPLIHWIWTGAALMVLGGFVSLIDRRHRIGVPMRIRKAAKAPAVAAAGD